MPLGTKVGISPAVIVLDGNPAPLLKKGAEPRPNFRPMSIVAKRLNGGPHLTQSRLGRGLPPYQVAFGRNRYGPKIGGLCPFGERGAGF